MAATAVPERATIIFQAKLAEYAERYDEMVESMKKAVANGPILTVEERNLLSVGYKNVIGARRSSWRVISSFEQREATSGNDTVLPTVRGYRIKIEEELHTICTDVLAMLENSLVPNAIDEEAKIFYLKMQGDYNRYLSEFSAGEEKKRAIEGALTAYETALATAAPNMPACHAIRLGLALNYSVFHCEIMNDREKACTIARDAFETAIGELDSLSEDNYRDSSLILQLLRDNLTLWTSDSGRSGDQYIEDVLDDEDDDDDDDLRQEDEEEDIQDVEREATPAQ
jgi:14-3-3 protein epsilon